MTAEDVLEEVQRRLREMKGLRDSRVIDRSAREMIIEKEREAEILARENGLMEVHNEGFWTTMERRCQVAIVLDWDNDVIVRSESLLQLKDQEGKLMGEWVNEDKAVDLSDRHDVQFVSKDFVLYGGVVPSGEPRFVLPVVDFPFLAGVKGITNVTSCSPSVQADMCIKKWFGFGDEEHLSHIVGFDLDEGRAR